MTTNGFRKTAGVAPMARMGRGGGEARTGGTEPEPEGSPCAVYVELPGDDSSPKRVDVRWVRKAVGGHEVYAICPCCGRTCKELFTFGSDIGCRKCVGISYAGRDYHGNEQYEKAIRPLQSALKKARRAQLERGANRSPGLDGVARMMEQSIAEVEEYMFSRAGTLAGITAK